MFLIREVFLGKQPRREESYRDALRMSDRERREKEGGQEMHVLRHKRNPLRKSGERERERDKEREEREKKEKGLRNGKG